MLAADIERVRKTGLTFAPEAGTQRLRDVINKNVTLEDLLGAVEAAARSGWRKIKLYFMIGQPTETDEDVVGIAEVVRAVMRRAKECGRPISVNVGVSSFVPKPHTPFQWRAQDELSEIERKFALLKDALNMKGVNLSWHDPKTSRIEAMLSRGDRRVGEAIDRAWKLGAKFDGWHEHFDYDRWLQAFEFAGIDPWKYANRRRDHEEPLPWDHIDTGITKQYLTVQDRLADQAVTTQDCRTGPCMNCGIKNLLPPEVDDCWRETKARFAASACDVHYSADSGSLPLRHRILITFAKGEGARWLGHLDLLRTFERAVRRAGLPLSYSEGFNPRPRMSFASALGVGITGGRELLMLELARDVDPKQVAKALASALSEGLYIVEVRALPADAPKSIQVEASEFEVIVSGAEVGVLRDAVAHFLARGDVIVERKKDGRATPVNIGTEILSIQIIESDNLELVMRLNHGRITPKPSEVVSALQDDLPGVELVRAHRARLITAVDSAKSKVESRLNKKGGERVCRKR